MNALVSLVLVCTVGMASQYGPGVMQSVIHNRHAIRSLPEHLPGVAGYVAVVDCRHIGSVWWINGDRFLVADCAGDEQTRQWMRWNNVVVEVDYETAVRWKSVGAGKQVTICRLPAGIGRIGAE
ncbi:MAG: hypothetical protein M1434_11550 [Chloroflexi bacterium]|nr:hypothetical protein [Chloroflexota bacterium]MCL5275357.1 hypothetical protein [Chloroflexota bacterium]